MIKALDFHIRRMDKFHYVPRLGFQGKAKQSSLLGGCSTIGIGLILSFVFLREIVKVIDNSDFYHLQIETAVDFAQLGQVKLDEMGTMPYYSVHYEGNRLKRTNDPNCSETGGDCMAFIKKYLDIKWLNAKKTETQYSEMPYETHACTVGEISMG
jgi:hypothetical protein